jgi:hypothetical protein
MSEGFFGSELGDTYNAEDPHRDVRNYFENIFQNIDDEMFDGARRSFEEEIENAERLIQEGSKEEWVSAGDNPLWFYLMLNIMNERYGSVLPDVDWVRDCMLHELAHGEEARSLGIDGVEYGIRFFGEDGNMTAIMPGIALTDGVEEGLKNKDIVREI